MHSLPGKIFSRQYFEIFFLIFLENRIWLLIQIVSKGENLHEISIPVFWEKSELLETIYIKCQILLSGKNKKEYKQFVVCWIVQRMFNPCPSE